MIDNNVRFSLTADLQLIRIPIFMPEADVSSGLKSVIQKVEPPNVAEHPTINIFLRIS